MLAGKRAVRVGDQLLREIANLIVTRVRDPRVKWVTLTGIDLSNDLRHARVYYSVMGEEKDYSRTQAGLDSAKGFIKKEVGSRMDLKYMPDITFKHDPSLEKGDRMEKILEGLKPDESKDASE